MKDYLIRATAANAQIRAFACTSRDLVEEARRDHETTPVVSAALGRLLTGGVMMGSMLKGEKDVLTLQIHAGGPINGLTVTADAKGNVKGFPGNPQVELPLNAKGKLDVGGAVGIGFMNVIKDMGLKEPYVGQTVLQTGEIADDLTFYFATSEQVPSSVGLGVYVDKDYSIEHAGGFIVQLMPFADEEVISKLEENLAKVDSITNLLRAGKTPEEILEIILEGFDVEITDKMDIQFECDCSRSKVEKVLISVGKKELQSMINDGEVIELNCHFCNKKYHFNVEELKSLYKKSLS